MRTCHVSSLPRVIIWGGGCEGWGPMRWATASSMTADISESSRSPRIVEEANVIERRVSSSRASHSLAPPPATSTDLTSDAKSAVNAATCERSRGTCLVTSYCSATWAISRREVAKNSSAFAPAKFGQRCEVHTCIHGKGVSEDQQGHLAASVGPGVGRYKHT